MAVWHIELAARAAAIVIRIEGAIESADAIDAAARTGVLLGRATEPLEVCIDLRSMTDYTVSAREHWSSLLKDHRPKIRLLTWVTTKSTHRMVGRTVGLFTGVTTRLLDELPREYALRAPVT